MPKRGRAYSKGEKGESSKGSVHSNRGSTHTFVYVFVTMGLIHCGFSVCLFLTLNTWMILKLGLLYIYC